ncbi:hypothetical protein BP6252_09665 [Coleophoma cylindrospora]|uniref:Apple domain-containing protein n=1 Tax=Coleophoma cylindrospora TaxID=1849047 RepID=A0A3D8QWG4_9HELO|nr:hypothetical protein BP6252_09665 [Coleophoma cylindrospora]
MRYSFAVVAMATMVAGQSLDLGLVSAAPAVTASGPAVSATAETITFSPAASGTAAVTGVATASATASQAANAKRAVIEARTVNVNNLLCQWFGWFCPASSTSTKATSTSCTTSTAAKTTAKTAAVSTSSGLIASITSIASISHITALPTPTGIPTTCVNTWTNTNAFTQDAACPTPYEVGTYCGFVNPEDPCATQPLGSGPAVSPDTSAAFLANPVFKSASLNAKTPSGYALTFQDYNASTSAATYLGLQTLTSYDPATCAAACDSTSTCTSFNIYIERDPSLNPSSTFCCPNPASITNYKCTLWGSIIDGTTATNAGQWRDGFEVVITGSNGYTKANTTTPVTPPGWTNPQSCDGAHSHPSTCIGNHFFPGPFDPQVCASFAQAQNIKNGASTGRGYANNHCNFFNAYMLKQDGKPKGTYCSLFAQQYDHSVATYHPGWLGGSYYDVETSWSFCSS